MMKVFVVIAACLAVALADFGGNDMRRRAMENPDLYDGDMAGIDGPFDAERNAIPQTNYRWPNAQVPYVVDRSLGNQMNVLNKAFQNYHTYTCIRFVARSNQRDYIKIFPGQGCYSHVGKTGGEQPLSLGNGCMYVGTVIHELGHALGFYHEQSRSDRDNYLYIYMNNVQKGMESNFNKLAPSQNILYTSFDYASIMIYGNKAFSKNGQDTMAAKNGQRLNDAYDKNSMTNSDAIRFRKMYNC